MTAQPKTRKALKLTTPPMPVGTVPVARLRILIRRYGQLRGNARREREAATHDYERAFLWGYVYGLGEAVADLRAIINEAKKGE